MTHIDLFSGIGGFALAAKWAGFKTVAFVEIDEYCQEIIKARFRAISVTNERCLHGRISQSDQRPMADGHARIFADIRDFDGTAYRGATLLTGGFPCQPFSQAGKRRGKEDDRYLWPQMLRVISEARPAWVVGENVAGIVAMELDRVLFDLEGEGYAVQSLVIPACAVDAKHRRDRVWIVGHAMQPRGQQITGSSHGDEGENEGRPAIYADELASTGEDVADALQFGQSGSMFAGANSQRQAGVNSNTGNDSHDESSGSCRWLPEPRLGRVAHGISHRVDRLKGLGNAIVPQVAYEILRAIAEVTRHDE